MTETIEAIELKRAQEKLFLLTGCPYFGDMDGMNGSCVDCSIDNEELWNRCRNFETQRFQYRQNRKEEN